MIESLVMKRDILQEISELNISQAQMTSTDGAAFDEQAFYSSIERKGRAYR